MKEHLLLAAVLASAAVVQGILPTAHWLGEVRTPVLMGSVLYYGLHHAPGTALLAAFIAGVMQDVSSPVPLGHSSLFFCIAAWMCSRLRGVAETETPLVQCLLGGAFSVVTTLGTTVLLVSRGLAVVNGSDVILKGGGAVLLGGVATPLVIRAARTLNAAAGVRP